MRGFTALRSRCAARMPHLQTPAMDALRETQRQANRALLAVDGMIHRRAVLVRPAASLTHWLCRVGECCRNILRKRCVIPELHRQTFARVDGW